MQLHRIRQFRMAQEEEEKDPDQATNLLMVVSNTVTNAASNVLEYGKSSIEKIKNHQPKSGKDAYVTKSGKKSARYYSHLWLVGDYLSYDGHSDPSGLCLQHGTIHNRKSYIRMVQNFAF